MRTFYPMESETETERLRATDDDGMTYRQLVATGTLSVAGPRPVTGAGCGIGLVGEAEGGTVKARFEFPGTARLYSSLKAHAAAPHRLGAAHEVLYQYLSCDVKNMPPESRCADHAFFRFAFKARSGPRPFFDELARLLLGPISKPALGDPDCGSMVYGALDADRNLYSFFHHAVFGGTQVYFRARHFFYGQLSVNENGPLKTDQLMELQQKGALRSDLGRFEEKFFEFLRSPGRFNYTPLILVEGRKPYE